MNSTLQVQTKSGGSASLAEAGGHLLQRKCACGGTPIFGGECAECRKKRQQAKPSFVSGHHLGEIRLQAKLTINSPHSRPMGNISRSSESFVAPPIVHEVLKESGRPLDPSAGALMESRFGRDFSHVACIMTPRQRNLPEPSVHWLTPRDAT